MLWRASSSLEGAASARSDGSAASGSSRSPVGRLMVSAIASIAAWNVVWVAGNFIFGFEADLPLQYSFLAFMLGGTVVTWFLILRRDRASAASSGTGRFRVSSWLICMAAICIIAAWSVWAVQHKARRELLMQAFERRGGIANQLHKVRGLSWEFLIPAGTFSEEELAELRGAFPDGRFSPQQAVAPPRLEPQELDRQRRTLPLDDVLSMSALQSSFAFSAAATSQV